MLTERSGVALDELDTWYPVALAPGQTGLLIFRIKGGRRVFEKRAVSILERVDTNHRIGLSVDIAGDERHNTTPGADVELSRLRSEGIARDVGWIGDRVAPLTLLRAGALLILLLAYPFYHALEARALSLTFVLVLAGLCGGLINGSFAVLLTDLFPTRIRFSGVALSFNIAFTIFSGMAPLFATTLIRETGLLAAPSFMGIACAALALVASLGVPRFGGHVLGGDQDR